MTAQLLPQPALRLQTERPADAHSVDALIDRVFGPGRLTKVSERVREFAQVRPDLSVCAFLDGELIGAVRQHLVRIAGRPVVFLGPLAVDAEARKHGVGAALVQQACEAARAAGYGVVLLVGDMGFFRRLGFEAEPAAGIVMPGPVDRRRVLLCELTPGAAEGLAGPLRP